MAAKVKYTINLNKVFNRAFSGKPAEVRNKARIKLTDPAFKRSYGLAVIDRIEQRTSKQRINKKNKSLGTYSKEYANSGFGKAYGKRTGGRVNLFASGDMLNSMRSKETTRTIIIDFPSQLQNDKAHGHINYNNAKRAPNGRDFFGLPPEDEEAIMVEVMRQSSQATSINALAEAFTGEFRTSQAAQTISVEQPDNLDLETLLTVFANGEF